MCRYANKLYKVHCACFACRKSFKRPHLWDYVRQQGLLPRYRELADVRYNKATRLLLEEQFGTTLDEIESQYISSVHKCPECGKTMANLGLDFKPPKETNIKAWKVIEGMHRTGHSFQTCGCMGFGYVPANASEYKSYLSNMLKHYQSNLATAGNYSRKSEEAKKAEFDYWASRIALVKKEISRIT